MDPITVSTSAPAPAPAAATAPVVDHSAELAALRAENAEVKRSAEFWQSRAIPAPVAAAPAAPEPEPEDDTDILDLLATQGAKGMDAYMKRRGYVKGSDVEATVNARTTQLSTEAELLANYPDLKDKNSEFFKATAANYGDLKNQGVSEALAMKLGAQQAELQGFKSGKVKTPTQAAADTAATKEANRLARIKAQAPDAQRSRTSAGIGEEDDDELSAFEKKICAGMGITEDAFKARSKSGVQMGGLGNK